MPARDAGGDNEVPRDRYGRPQVVVPCSSCEGTGKVPSLKTGRPVKHVQCAGKGFKLKAYTRTTTYIDVIEDKSNLMAWGERMVLIGAAQDPGLLYGALDDAYAAEHDDTAEGRKDAKDSLNRKAQMAKTKAGASLKADKGTELHGLSELVDQGIPLPAGISFEDMIDMDAYKQATKGFYIVHMEKLVVHDAICVAGTPDRVSEWKGDHPLIAPDGYVFEPGSGERLITDLKTGTTEYGQLKMAMQLSIYSRSLLYDYTTGERSPLENINQKWGIIMNIPAGSGEATLYWADLEMGWEAVEIAGKIRALRSAGRKALTELSAA